MKISLIFLAVSCLATRALGGDCPERCTCSDEMTSEASCSHLDEDMIFPERVKHLIVDSVPNLKINLTKGFFSKIGLQQVTSIKITKCSISFIHYDAFEGIPELNEVDLSDNGLILIHPDTFAKNNNLERLKLSGNPLQLSQILQGEENYFLKSSSLQELDLSRCQLSDIRSKLLSQVPNLQYINLKSNNIKVIDDYIFENTPFLEEVDLSNNLLMSLNDEIFEDIEELTTLNLQNNLLENIDDLDLPGLKELDVSHNNIKMLKKNMFEGISDLTTLNMSHNEITWVSEETFKDLTQLRHLDLSHNALIGPLPKFIFEGNELLETLSLGGNKEIHIFEGFSTELPKLYQLDISDCGLSNVTNTSFSGMTELAILNMSRNSFTILNHLIMSKLHRLNVLDLSHNEITKVGAYTFASNTYLKKVDMSHNKIHHISPFTFETTPSLSRLDLSHNLLPHMWHANESDYMRENSILNELEYLNIANNRIKILHKHSFTHLTNLKALNIRGNPLECTTEFPLFVEWLYMKRVHPVDYDGKSAQLEAKLEKSNLQWDDLQMEICKPQPGKIEIETKPIKDDSSKEHSLNFYEYTVIQDVKLNHNTEEELPTSEEKEKLAEELTTYVWPTFLVVFSLVFLVLAVGNTVALLIYRHRHQYDTASFRAAFVSPFKRNVVKLPQTPRYHKLYEECSVPNTPIVKGNLLGNLVTSQIGAVLSKNKSDDVV